MFDQRRVNLRPTALERSPAVRRDWDLAALAAVLLVGGLLSGEEGLRVDGHGCVLLGLVGGLDGRCVGGADEHLIVLVVGDDGCIVQVLSDLLRVGSLQSGRGRHICGGCGDRWVSVVVIADGEWVFSRRESIARQMGIRLVKVSLGERRLLRRQ